MRNSDFFDRVKIAQVSEMIACDTCIFTVVSPGYEALLDDMLLSLVVNGDVADAKIVVFVVNPDDSCLKVVCKYNAYPIICYASSTNIDTKSVIYNIVDLVKAQKYIYLDTDVLVLHSLQPLFDLLDNIPEENVAMCEDQYFGWAKSLISAHTGTLYNGKSSDFDYLLKKDNVDIDALKKFPSVINAGVFACKYAGLAKLYHTILSFNDIVSWSKDGFIREQFLVNLSLAYNNNLTVIHPKYNWQMAVRTVLKFGKTNNQVFDVHIGYNPVFLNHLPDPIGVFDKLNDLSDPFSQLLMDRLPEDHYNSVRTIKQSGLDRLGLINLLERVLNYLINQNDLFNNQFLRNMGKEIVIPLISAYDIISMNKNIILTHYLDEENCFDHRFKYTEPTAILHFNGLLKNINNVRNILRDQMLLKQNGYKPEKQPKKNAAIKIVISTHKNYQDSTLPMLLESLRISGVPVSQILVVSGGWEQDGSHMDDGIMYHNVMHNSFDHTGLIDILENDIHSKFWFSIQDTCSAGKDFYTNLIEADRSYDYLSVDGQGYLNMGLFSWSYLQSIKPYILSLKSCTKERAMLSEKMYMAMGNANHFGDIYPVFVGYADIYNTGVNRNICYYQSIDLYKYQANIVETFNICNP